MFISCENLVFGYTDENSVLNDVSFSLSKGKTLAIVGASGCGKSTLLRIISGILPYPKNNQFQGKVLIENQTPDQYRKTGKLAYMFQEPTLMPHLTVKENIELPLKIKGLFNKPKVNDLIKSVGLEQYSHFLPNQLSGGMKTRVALARAFVTEPELLLLDEPFSALDIGWKSDLYKRLVSLIEEFHTSVVIVTHDVQESIVLANDIIVLNRLGVIQSKLTVGTAQSIGKRVQDIAGFLNDKAFIELYPLLQQAIILEEERQGIKKDEVNRILNKLKKSVGDALTENSIENNILDPIRQYANEDEIHKTLIDLFSKAQTLRLKYILLWDILEYEQLTDEIHKTYYDFYIKNIEIFSAWSRDWYKMHNDNRFLDILIGRIKTVKGYNKRKKWLYICDLYAVINLPELTPFLDDILSGLVEEANFPLAQQAAEYIKTKMRNQK